MADDEGKIGEKRGFRSLAATLTIAFLMLSLAILIISGSLELFFTYKSRQAVIAEQQRLIAQNAAQSVKNYVEERFSLLRVTARLKRLIDAPPEDRKATLNKLLGLEPSFDRLALLDTGESEVLSVSRKSQFASSADAGKMVKQAFTAINRGEAFISPVYIDETSSEPLVELAVPVNDVFGDFKGVLLAEVNLKFMWELVGRITIGRSGLAYVVDREGYLIAANDISRVLKREKVQRLKEVADFVGGKDTAPERPVTISKGFQNTRVVSDHVELGTPDWAVVTELPVGEAFAPLIDKIKITGGIVLASFLFAALVGGYLSRRISLPIIALRNATAKIGEGRFDTRIKTGAAKEIGELAASINLMAGDLQRTMTSIDNLNREIAERKKAEEELQEHYEKLRELERLRDNLTNMIVHDLRSPLSGVFGYLDLMLIKLKGSSDGDLVGFVKDSMDLLLALTDMIDTLLDVGRLEEGKMPLVIQECNPMALAREAVGSLGALKDKCAIGFEITGVDNNVRCDRDIVRRVFANLIGNALKFTPAAGRIVVAAGVSNGDLRFTVSDTGPGIDPAYHNKIFEKFGQLSMHREGLMHSSGLGLTFCKLAVEAHGGSIGVESGAGKGSTFWFTLPLARRPVCASVSAA